MRIVLEKYQSNSFSRLCPNESLFVGRSVINTLPCSKFLKKKRAFQRSQSSKPLLREHQAINIIKSVHGFRSP